MPQSPKSSQRLDRLLAGATDLSRVEAQRAIRVGEVQVDGRVVSDPATRIPPGAQVEYAGQDLAMTGYRYFMLNKPAGVVCATRDREHRTVLDLLDVPNRSSLHIAGRLDIDATGLVLITDDGDWSHRIMSPRHKLPKTYRVQLAEPIDDSALAALRAGVTLRGEDRPCAPAVVELLSPAEIRLTITEGRYHQVKRMLAATGNHVRQLHRERVGNVVLDPSLAPTAYRPLTDRELDDAKSP